MSFPSVLDYGVTGDGATDDAANIRTAIAANAGKTLYFPDPAVAYKCGSSLGPIPANTRLAGFNKASTKLRKAFAGGSLLTLGDGCSLDNLWIEGDGSNFTGKGVVLSGNDVGNQSITNCKIVNFESTPLHITDTAGSRLNVSNLEVWRTGGTAAGKFAIVIDDLGAPGPGRPMSFTHVETGGNRSFSFGSSNDVYIASSTLFDLEYSQHSRGVHISNSRIANPSPITLLGTGDVVGCSFGAQVTIGANAAFNLGPNFYNNGWADESGVGQSLVFDQLVIPYEPVFSCGGQQVDIGNGSISGIYTRTGTMIYFNATLNVGSTTTVPIGAMTVTIPVPSLHVTVQSGISGRLFSSANVLYRINGYIVRLAGECHLERDVTGAVGAGSPGPLGSGAVIQISGCYTI